MKNSRNDPIEGVPVKLCSYRGPPQCPEIVELSELFCDEHCLSWSSLRSKPNDLETMA